jgi:hypothetical protein
MGETIMKVWEVEFPSRKKKIPWFSFVFKAETKELAITEAKRLLVLFGEKESDFKTPKARETEQTIK